MGSIFRWKWSLSDTQWTWAVCHHWYEGIRWTWQAKVLVPINDEIKWGRNLHSWERNHICGWTGSGVGGIWLKQIEIWWLISAWKKTHQGLFSEKCIQAPLRATCPTAIAVYTRDVVRLSASELVSAAHIPLCTSLSYRADDRTWTCTGVAH